MVIDTSALVAVMKNESESRRFNELIEAAPAPKSAPRICSRLEEFYALDPVKTPFWPLDALLLKSRMNVLEVSPRIADIAFEAYRKYRKGTGHGAACLQRWPLCRR